MYVVYKDFSMLTGQTGLPPYQRKREKLAKLQHFSTNLVETWYAVSKWKDSSYVCDL